MMTISTNTKELLSEIETLSPSYLRELQVFVQYLKYKQSNLMESSTTIDTLNKKNDPILNAIGFVEATPFSERIDETLYGNV